jgi:hypothetical protein
MGVKDSKKTIDRKRSNKEDSKRIGRISSFEDRNRRRQAKKG